MWKAFDGSLVTTVCRSSLARKILCNNKCEGCWWEAEGGVHFSQFLLFSFFFFVSCFVTAERGIYKMTQKSHRPGREWGSKKTMKNALCIFSNIWSLVPMNVVFWCPMPGPAGCQPQQCHRQGETRSCFHLSWLRWGVWWELERMKMSLLSWKSLVPTVYSAFRQTLPWPGKMRTPELARWWGCKARLTPVYRAAECLIKSTGIQWKSSFKPEF